MSTFDVVIIGGGPAGERAATQAARAGKRVALVERANVVGGTCINWGAIPSKTLRESALFWHQITRAPLHGIQVAPPEELTVAGFMWREKLVVSRELELLNSGLARRKVEIFQGHGQLVDPHTVAVLGSEGQSRTLLEGDHIVIATGSSPHHPDDIPFDDRCLFDSDTILKMPRIPRSMIVLGAGVIGLEYAAMFSALGIEVTLIDTRSELLPYMDREIATLLERELRGLGMIIVHDDHYARVELDSREATNPGVPGVPEHVPTVRCHTRQGNVIEADVMLYCVGREGNTRKLGLEHIGVTPTSRGLLEVNEHFQLEIVPHIYAIGDVIGYPALASTSMEQGRQAMRHAFDLSGPVGNTAVLPFAIYAIPEVSYIGETEEALIEKGVPYIAGRGAYRENPRAQILGDLGGLVKLLFHQDTLVLLGAHVLGTNASELIHTAQVYLGQGATATAVAEALYNYPTLSDLYRYAALDALRQDRRRRAALTGEPCDDAV